MPTHSTRAIFPSDATAPGHVRTFVERHLGACGHHAPIPNVQLLASEVVTNAVIHTDCATCEVRLDIDDHAVRLAVTDCDRSHMPELLPPDPGRFGGYGMHIVDDVAHRWGCDVTPAGKTVWFELPHPAA